MFACFCVWIGVFVHLCICVCISICVPICVSISMCAPSDVSNKICLYPRFFSGALWKYWTYWNIFFSFSISRIINTVNKKKSGEQKINAERTIPFLFAYYLQNNKRKIYKMRRIQNKEKINTMDKTEGKKIGRKFIIIYTVYRAD